MSAKDLVFKCIWIYDGHISFVLSIYEIKNDVSSSNIHKYANTF